jgi:hypothetical protein
MISSKAILLTAASVSLGMAGVTAANSAGAHNPYVAGDMHNHNTCTDGSVAAGYSIDRAVGAGTSPTGGQNFNLDWFTLGNHGGAGNRDCRFSDTSAQLPGQTTTTWSQTLGQTIDGILITSLKGTPNNGNMWRWQSIREVEWPTVVNRSQVYNKVIIEGLEWIVPGHEHTDVAVIAGQHPAGFTAGNADKMAEFEYRFDRADTDAIGPVRPNNSQLWTGKDNVNNNGTAGHGKALTAVAWLQQNYPLQSYAVPTHTERQGPFSTASSKGYNIEHFRNFNNAGPTVAFGIESPGHMAQSKTTGGTYGSGAVGGGTYGLQGVYTAKVGGLWDGMLGEGRNFFIFVSSDWHQRGIFGASSPSTTEDFMPGEYTKLYVPNVGVAGRLTHQKIIDGMRSGNSYSVNGDVIGPDLVFRARVKDVSGWVSMGETLIASPGDTVQVQMIMTVPAQNNSPYSFNNPLLTPVGLSQPLNKPSIDHVDLITGNVTGVIDPSSPNYAVANTAGVSGAAIVYNPSAKIAKQIQASNMNPVHNADGSTKLTFSTSFKMGSTPFYIRARGTNIPVGTPNVSDSAGNPLIDTMGSSVNCADAACPAHLEVVGGNKKVSNDVYGWSNLWFYANPIFVRPDGSPKLLVETNAALARTLAGN